MYQTLYLLECVYTHVNDEGQGRLAEVQGPSEAFNKDLHKRKSRAT